MFKRRFNKLNPMADLGGEYAKVINVCLRDKDGARTDDWHFELPSEVATVLKNAFEAALAAGKELWVWVMWWNDGEPFEFHECPPPPQKPKIAIETVDLLSTLDQASLLALRNTNNFSNEVKAKDRKSNPSLR